MEFLQELFTLQGLFTLMMLVVLQAVLGFDNLLYISIESKRVEASQQQRVRRIGIALAIVLRIALLFVVKSMINAFEEPFFSLGSEEKQSWIRCAMNLESLVELIGGAFILYTALKEIIHMISSEELEHGSSTATRSFNSALFWILLMNLVFSFDSILSAMALTESMAIMSLAIVISGVLMIVLADNVAVFLQKNRMYEVLGLFILFIVGVMLVSEGGHKAHFAFFGHDIEAMQKSTFYFVIGVLIVVDIIQSRYQKRLLAAKARKSAEVGQTH